jgi:hypothetical protein
MMKKNMNPNKKGNGYFQLIQERNKHKPSTNGKYHNSDYNKTSPYGDYYYPSLWGYYNLLPVQLRNHPFTMVILQGLEKYHYKVV